MVLPINIPTATSDDTETYMGVTVDGLLRRYEKPSGGGGTDGADGAGVAYETRAAAAAATIASDLKTLHTDGYATAGDGGQGLYKRLSSHPHPLWVTGTNYMFSTKFVRNSAGLLYRLTRDPGGTDSTNEPVHETVGSEVQGADGYKWMRVNLNTGFFRSVDRFKFDGTSDATDGGWWQLVPEGGTVNIEQFGGAADTSIAGVGGTDNYQPLTDAIHFTSWSFITAPYSYKIQLGTGNYRFSAGFDIHTIVNISGVWGTGQYQGGTALHFPNTVDPFIFGNNATSGATGLTTGLGESIGSILENVSIWGGGGLGIFTDADRTMIRIRTQVTIQNFSLYGIPGRGIYIIGGGGDGNANDWVVKAGYIHEAGSDYFKVQGSDANGGHCIGLVTHGEGGRGGCGIIETGGLGCNYYSGIQITGYGNTGVEHDGNLYQLINGSSPTIGASTTPGTNDLIWMFIRAGGTPGVGYNTVQFPAWSALGTYTLQCPAFFESGPSVLDAIYCENSEIAAQISSGAIVIGGNLSVTRYSNKLVFQGGTADNELQNTQSYTSTRAFPVGTAEETAHGEYVEVNLGASASTGWGATGGKQVFKHRREKDAGGVWYQYGHIGDDLIYRLPGTADFWSINGLNTTRTFGRDTPQPHIFSFGDFAIGDSTDSPYTTARIFGLRATRPSSGNHARGEWVWPQNPTTWGTAAWVCTVTGTPGTWGQVPLFGLTSIDPANNGEMVIEATSNTSAKLKYRGSDGVVRSITFTLA